MTQQDPNAKTPTPLSDRLCSLPWPDLFRRMILAWLIAALIEYILLPGSLRDLSTLSSLGHMSLVRLILITAVLFLGFQFLPRGSYAKPVEQAGICAAAGALLALGSRANPGIPFALACLALVGLILRYALREQIHLSLEADEHKLSILVTGLLSFLFFLFVRNWGVGRIESFSVSTYDFGIFAQMFHNMKTTGLPMTTIERDGLLSHFQVHVSPIYYLMLPFYALFPKPQTLQVLQAAVLTSAVIPLWLLGKRHGLRPVERMMLCVILLAFPAYSGGTSYDLHENCFLTPLLFWLFYGIDQKNVRITAISATLVLLVKEDAAVYVAAIGLWLMVSGLAGSREKTESLRWGGILVGCSVLWFLGVTWYLANHGDGVMSSRYDNLIYGDSGSLLSVIGTALVNPLKILYECVDEEKLKYITYTMVPLLFIPLLSKQYAQYLLLIPYMLVNLMSDYTYQHDIFFQYSYGSAAFLFYLFLANLSHWKQDWKRICALMAALVISCCLLGKEVIPKAIQYPTYCAEYKDYYDGLREALDQVPDDVSVAASTYLTTYLSQRADLYDICYAKEENILSCSHVVLKKTDSYSYRRYELDGANGFENFVQFLLDNGYSLWLDQGGIAVYQKAQ